MSLRVNNVLRSLRLTDRDVWLGRGIIWLTAAITTFILVGFNRLVDIAIAWFGALHVNHPWAPWLLTPLGGMLIVGLLLRFCNGAQGSGIPQVIVAQHSKGSLQGLASIRIAIGKILLGTAALGCGFSTGREGPSVQIAASLMAACQRFIPKRLKIHREELLLAGGAVGIAAAFNTPIAGVVFAIEELGQRFKTRTNGVILAAIVFAGLISIDLQGNYNYFGRLPVPDSSQQLIIPVLLMGICSGVFGGLFSRFLLLGTGPWPGLPGHFKKNYPLLFAGICGLLVAALGFFSHGMTFGSGYLATQHALHTSSTLPESFSILKFLATLISYIAGIPGGIFAPSLSVGAGLGQNLAALHLIDLSTTAWMVLGMVAFMGGVTQAPITSVVIVMEMTEGHPMILAMIAAALISSAISRAICPPLYHALAHRMMRDRAQISAKKPA